MKLNLLTIVGLALVCYSLNAKELAHALDTTPGNTGMVEQGIRYGHESPPTPQEGVRNGVSIPLEPSKDSGHSGASEGASAGEGTKEAAKKVGWFDFDKQWKKVTSWKDRKIQGGRNYLEKRKYSKTYGEQNSSPESIIELKGHEYAIGEADTIRDQREMVRQLQQEQDDLLLEDSLMCLTTMLWREARGETVSQEAATAMVVMNRLSVGFRGATTICGVITTPAQFTGINKHGIRVPDFKTATDEGSWQRSLLIARRMMDRDAMYIDTTNGALYYYNPEKVKRRTGKDWEYAKDYRQTAILGNHRFMGEKSRKSKDYIDDNSIRINPVLFNGLSHAERNAMKKRYQLAKKG